MWVWVRVSRRCIMIIIICKLKTFQQNRVHSHRSNAFCCLTSFFAFCAAAAADDDRKINRNSNERTDTGAMEYEGECLRVWVSVCRLACWTTRIQPYHRMHNVQICNTRRHNRSIPLFASAKHYFVQVYWSNELWWRDSKRFKCMNALTFICMILLLCWIGTGTGNRYGSCSCSDYDFLHAIVCASVFLFARFAGFTHSFMHSLIGSHRRQYKNWMQQQQP